jgi:hypothetical protein
MLALLVHFKSDPAAKKFNQFKIFQKMVDIEPSLTAFFSKNGRH